MSETTEEADASPRFNLRQRQVYGALLDGASRHEVCAKFGISRSTLRRIIHVFKKAGAEPVPSGKPGPDRPTVVQRLRRFTEEDYAKIREDYAAKMTWMDLCKKWNCSAGVITRALKGKYAAQTANENARAVEVQLLQAAVDRLNQDGEDTMGSKTKAPTTTDDPLQPVLKALLIKARKAGVSKMTLDVAAEEVQLTYVQTRNFVLRDKE